MSLLRMVESEIGKFASRLDEENLQLNLQSSRYRRQHFGGLLMISLPEM